LNGKEYAFWIDEEYFMRPREKDFGKLIYRKERFRIKQGPEYELKFVEFRKNERLEEGRMIFETG
jgi:hypothetical protein